MFVEVFDFIGFIRKNLFFFRLRHFWVILLDLFAKICFFSG